MLGEKKARSVCQDILKRCASYPGEVLLIVEDKALTRFANNYIHQNVAETNAELLVRVFDGKRSGIASTNRMDPVALDEVVDRAIANAKASAEDPDELGLAEPASYEEVQSFDNATADFDPTSRARMVGVVCRLAEEQQLNASGAFSNGMDETVIANTEGVFAYHIATAADFQTVVLGEDSSGQAQSSGWQIEKIDVEALGREAILKATKGRNPQNIDPGEYTVVVDPYVTQDIITSLNFYGMGAQAVQEGQSWMNDRIGAQEMNSQVNIWDDGLDPRGKPMPFDYEGVPKQRVDIVENGVIQGPVYDRYTAGKEEKTTTGHALPPTARRFGPVAINMFMAAGSTSTEALIASTERGLYITRFWYTRLVHPSDCVVTGMTRDGLFMIEKGEITFPVKDLRFTQSYVQALANLEVLGSETRLLTGEFDGIATFVPALKIKSFNFTGSTV